MQILLLNYLHNQPILLLFIYLSYSSSAVVVVAFTPIDFKISCFFSISTFFFCIGFNVYAVIESTAATTTTNIVEYIIYTYYFVPFLYNFRLLNLSYNFSSSQTSFYIRLYHIIIDKWCKHVHKQYCQHHTFRICRI
jgi:hypothetical protein